MIIGSGTNDNRINPVYLTGRIGTEAFRDVPFTGVLIFPEGVKSIGESAFDGCTGITEAYFRGNALENYGENAFADCADGFTIYYYEGNEGWSTPEWKGYPCYPLGAIPGQPGDMNGDGRVDSNDAIRLLRHVMSPERYPLF